LSARKYSRINDYIKVLTKLKDSKKPEDKKIYRRVLKNAVDDIIFIDKLLPELAIESALKILKVIK